MKLLAHPTRNLFFTGKGGVGKTSLACAMTDPVLLARQRQEGKYICEVIQRLAASTAIVPWLAVPPVGAESLGPVVYGLWDGSSVRAATA